MVLENISQDQVRKNYFGLRFLTTAFIILPLNMEQHITFIEKSYMVLQKVGNKDKNTKISIQDINIRAGKTYVALH